jgi:hypothetical protein
MEIAPQSVCSDGVLIDYFCSMRWGNKNDDPSLMSMASRFSA